MKFIPLAILLAASPAAAGPYAFVEGGATKWGATSNSDELETGSEAGWMAGVGGGYRWDGRGIAGGSLGDRFSLGIEGEFSARGHHLHGYNVDGHRESADGNELLVGGLLLNLRPCVALYGPVSACGLVGAGGAHLSALDDTAITPAWQVGGGLAVDLEPFTGKPLTFSFGVRRFEARPVDLAGAEAEFTTRELNARVTYSFNIGE